MSFRNCIDNAEASGEIDPRRARAIRDLLDEEEAAAAAELGPDAAASEGARRAFARLEAEAVESKRRKRIAMARARDVRRRVLQRRSWDGKSDPAAAIPDLIEHFGTTPDSSVWSRYREILGRAHRSMTDAIFRFERDPLSRTRNRAELDNVIDELYGADTGDAAARQMAEAWRIVAEYLRKRFNAAGGNIGYREDWALPQAWDSVAVSKAGFSKWRDEILPHLDRAKMRDHLTGRPLSDERLETLMREAYDAIVSDGWSRREATQAQGGRSLARRRTESRFFVFKDGAGYRAVQGRYGHSDAFGAMMEHIDRMSREIAAMEILGPNPNAMLAFAEQLAMKEAAEGRTSAVTPFDAATATIPGVSRAPDGPQSRVASQARLARNMLGFHLGGAYNPVDGKLARTVGSVAQLAVASKLGSATLSAISDPVFKKLNRRFNGLPESGAIRGTMRLFNPANAEDRRLAVRAGLVADGAAGVMQGQARYVGEFHAHEWTKRVADVTLRASGLSPLTQFGKWSAGQEWQGYFADFVRAGTGFEDLPADFQAMLNRHGLGGEAWDVLRRADLDEPRPGAVFLRPDAIEATDLPGASDLARRYMEALQIETAFETPSASYRGQAFLTGDARPGTFLGTIARSVSMFKSFPVTVFFLATARLRHSMAAGISSGRGAGLAASYAGIFATRYMIYLTLAGAVSLQLKELSKGRDPRPMTSAQFWGAAAMQGGGLGIFGDYLFADINRFGGGLPQTVAGPMLQTGGEAINLTAGNALQLAQGEDTNAGAEAMRFIRGNTPGASIWYGRLAFERLALDQLDMLIDPDAPARFARQERRFQRDYGQDYWWAPGETAPERAPDLENAAAPAPE
jgi:hypothetical protein